MSNYAPVGSYWEGDTLIHVYPMKRTRKKIKWTKQEAPSFQISGAVRIRAQKKSK